MNVPDNPEVKMDYKWDYSQQNDGDKQKRTLTLIMEIAIGELFKDVELIHEFSVGHGSFFRTKSERPLLPNDIVKIKNLMNKLIKEKRRLNALKLSRSDVVNWLERSKRVKSLRWINDRETIQPWFYNWKDRIIPFDGPLCDNTQDVGKWDLIYYPPGLMLQRQAPGTSELGRLEECTNLFRNFFEAQKWGSIQKANYMGDVNKLLRDDKIGELILVSEALQERKIANVADKIISTYPRPKIILISGPSSSGKTSFSRRLKIQLTLLGLEARIMGLDNFYLPRDQVPRQPNGDYDFESLGALDIELLNDVLLRLVAGQEVRRPELDFKTHLRKFGEPIRLADNGLLIIEGIHGLNPEIVQRVAAPSLYKVFVSALFNMKLDSLNRVSTTDLRLLRRMIRDNRARGYSTEETLNRWPSVRDGEKKHIFLYQEEADIMFNSALPYELNLLKPYAERYLKTITSENLMPEVERLMDLLSCVREIPEELVERHLPPVSIAREFIGGSVLVD